MRKTSKTVLKLVLLISVLALAASAQSGYGQWNVSTLQNNGEQTSTTYQTYTPWATSTASCLPPNVGANNFRQVGGSVRTYEFCPNAPAPSIEYALAQITTDDPQHTGDWTMYWYSEVDSGPYETMVYYWSASSNCTRPTDTPTPANYADAVDIYYEYNGNCS